MDGRLSLSAQRASLRRLTDSCLPDRDSDITMLAMSNSQERDQEDWEELLRGADPKFKLEEVKRIPGAKLDLIIARWEGGGA